MKQISMVCSTAYIPDDWVVLNAGAAPQSSEAMAVALYRTPGIPVMVYFHAAPCGHEERGVIDAAKALALAAIEDHGWALPDPPQWGFFPLPEEPDADEPHKVWPGFTEGVRIMRRH